LLLLSKHNFGGARGLSEHLGEHVSGNGDYGVGGIVGPDFVTEGHKGKPMASFCPSFWADHRFILVPFFTNAMPWGFGQPSEFAFPETPEAVGRRSTRPKGKLWGQEYKDLMRQFGPRMITMVCLGLDRCEGRVRTAFTPTGTKIAVEWPTTHPET